MNNHYMIATNFSMERLFILAVICNKYFRRTFLKFASSSINAILQFVVYLLSISVNHYPRVIIHFVNNVSGFKAKSGPGDMDRSAFKSCAVCKPNSSTWIVVTLKCQRKMRSVLRRKKVLRIKECKCLAENIN